MEVGSIGISLIVFLATVGISLYTMYKNHSMLYSWMLKPYYVVRERSYYQLITSGFIHANFQHLLFNMLSFFFFAFQLEAIVGPINFLIIYFVGMVISDIPTLIKEKDNPEYASLGASGAVSAVVFSSILFNPMAKMMILPFPVGIPAFLFGIIYIVWCYFAEKQSVDMINQSAHLWGALAGIALTLLLIPQSLGVFIEALSNGF